MVYYPKPLQFPKMKMPSLNAKIRASMMQHLLGAGNMPTVVGGLPLFTGSYTGDGNATQAVAGIGFQPIFMLLYSQADGYGIGWKSNQDGLNALYAQAQWYMAYNTDQIISLDADGFTVGDGTPVAINIFNVLARVYTYVCWGSTYRDRIYRSSYTGDGATTQAIIGAGFLPKFVMIRCRGLATSSYPAGWKTDQDGLNAYRWSGGIGCRYRVDDIISLDADGFTVGDGTGLWNDFNFGAIDYSFECWE